jgi:GR25 family glycosyltransferase involved in LPS biosynthesis
VSLQPLGDEYLMTELPLKVFLIKTPANNRGLKLINALASDQSVSLHIFEAIMIDSAKTLSNSGVSVRGEVFKAYTGRDLSFPEIGCAASHNEIRHLISSLDIGAVVFEDDAAIIDFDNFHRVCADFLKAYNNEAAVLSLTLPTKLARRHGDRAATRLIKLFGPAPLAAAYAITPLAAARLFKTNSEITYVADWPNADVNFFCLTSPLATHNEDDSSSTIDPSNSLKRNQSSISRRIQLLLCIDYVRRARKYISFRDYIAYHFKKPFLYYLDVSRIKIFLALGI